MNYKIISSLFITLLSFSFSMAETDGTDQEPLTDGALIIESEKESCLPYVSKYIPGQHFIHECQQVNSTIITNVVSTEEDTATACRRAALGDGKCGIYKIPFGHSMKRLKCRKLNTLKIYFKRANKARCPSGYVDETNS